MIESDRQQFAILIGDVHAFYGAPVTPFALSVWWSACQPFPLDSVSKALTAHAMDPDTGQFAPKPADVIRHLRGTSRNDAIIGWQSVIAQVSSVGRYGEPTLSDASRQALTAIGGWHRLCNSQESELGHLQRQFCDNFAAYSQAEQRLQLTSSSVEKIAQDAIKRIATGVGDD